MFLKKNPHKNNRIYLSICKSFRKPNSKKTTHKTIQSLGYLDVLKKDYPDPIEHFTKLAKKMTEEENSNRYLEIKLDLNEKLSTDTKDIKNIGFTALSRIYHELGIHKFLINRERTIKYKYPLNNIMKLLVYSRILEPASKLSTYENRDFFAENFDIKQEEIYRSLRVFSKYKNVLILSIHQNIDAMYKRDTTNVFYDVTNYYFHTDKESELIKNGFSKDSKVKPIVQMGLLLDNKGIPMTYKLFQGNTTDFETLLPILDEVKRNFKLNKIIVVADKGLNSGSNKAYNIIKGDGYIFSRSFRGTKADKETKDYALNEEGYVWINDDYKVKSGVYPTDIWIEDKNGKRKKVTIDEKHIVFYSEKYARRSRYNRNKLIEKAQELINSPNKYLKAENYGALKYIKGMKLDKKNRGTLL